MKKSHTKDKSSMRRSWEPYGLAQMYRMKLHYRRSPWKAKALLHSGRDFDFAFFLQGKQQSAARLLLEQPVGLSPVPGLAEDCGNCWSTFGPVSGDNGAGGFQFAMVDGSASYAIGLRQGIPPVWNNPAKNRLMTPAKNEILGQNFCPVISSRRRTWL